MGSSRFSGCRLARCCSEEIQQVVQRHCYTRDSPASGAEAQRAPGSAASRPGHCPPRTAGPPAPGPMWPPHHLLQMPYEKRVETREGLEI